MRDTRNRRYAHIEEEYTSAYDSTLWSECIVGTGAVSIASSKLKLNTPANNDVAALVTKKPYYLRNMRISVANVDVATSAPARAGIVIAKTKTTNSNPETLNDSIRFCLDAVNSKYVITTDVGGTEKVLYNAAWTDGDGQLQLDMEPDGYFSLYEDSTLRIVGSNPLTATDTTDIFNLYIYQYAIGLTGTLGYGLLDNFRLNLDLNPTQDVSGSGNRLAATRAGTPVFGRLIDSAGTADMFETDHALTDTPTQRIVLSRDCKRFKIEEIRYYMDCTAAVTYQLGLYEAAKADDVASYMHMVYASDTTMADATTYLQTINLYGMTGAAAENTVTCLPVTANLERPGQLWYNTNWSLAPGDTKGYIVVIGKEVE